MYRFAERSAADLRSTLRSSAWPFHTVDPLGFAGGTTNLFEYVGNDPINKIDPSGLQEVDPTSYDSKTMWKGVTQAAQDRKLPQRLIRDAIANGIPIAHSTADDGGTRYTYNPIKAIDNFGNTGRIEVSTVDARFLGMYGSASPYLNKKHGSLGSIYNELFHSLVHKEVEHNDKSWLRRAMNRETNACGYTSLAMTNEAMSELIDKLITLLEEKKPLPKYEDVKNDPSWRSYLAPTHNEEPEDSFYGKPAANKVMTKELGLVA